MVEQGPEGAARLQRGVGHRPDAAAVGAGHDLVLDRDQAPDADSRQVGVVQSPGRAAVQRLDDADFRRRPQAVGVARPHQQVVDGHIGEPVRAVDARAVVAGDVRPGHAQVGRAQDLRALREAEHDIGGVRVGRVRGQARDAAHRGQRVQRRHRERGAVVRRDHDLARGVHAGAGPDDVRVGLGHAHVVERADRTPVARRDRRRRPALAEVRRFPDTRRAHREDGLGALLALADFRDERRVGTARVRQAGGGQRPRHAAVDRAPQAVVLVAADQLQRVVEVPRGLVTVAADTEIPRGHGAGIVLRLPGAVVLRAADVGAGAGALVHAVELRRDHARHRHREARGTGRRAVDAAVARAQQEPVAGGAAGNLHGL